MCLVWATRWEVDTPVLVALLPPLPFQRKIKVNPTSMHAWGAARGRQPGAVASSQCFLTEVALAVISRLAKALGAHRVRMRTGRVTMCTCAAVWHAVSGASPAAGAAEGVGRYSARKQHVHMPRNLIRYIQRRPQERPQPWSCPAGGGSSAPCAALHNHTIQGKNTACTHW